MGTAAPGWFVVENTYADDLPELCTPWSAAIAPAPRMLMLNEPLAEQLGLDPVRLGAADGVAVLVGNAVPGGATPVALAYAGHQFGGYSPRLGDGRALLIGEIISPDQARRDLHLKGSGRTPFARGGDGKAAVGPMLREYVISEAMHALGIPTTRSLAVVATGEQIAREIPRPGAVLARVAASHLRVGTFQYAAATGGPELVGRLARHAIARHHPEVAGAPVPALGLLEAVCLAQARLIAQWMAVGFIHGVMNTDNMTISGETIDYGPCAFMDRYDPATVFSSIDHDGRYSYRNQPAIGQWNLARLAEALLPLIDDDTERAVESAMGVLTDYSRHYETAWLEAMRTKFGLHTALDGDRALIETFLDLLHSEQLDYTGCFRSLADALAGRHRSEPSPLDRPQLTTWTATWRQRVATEGLDPCAVAHEMDSVNPIYIPRNHAVEAALDSAANDDDLEPLHRLVTGLATPFTARPDFENLAEPAPLGPVRYRTFCGT